jgi:hypothetical protein
MTGLAGNTTQLYGLKASSISELESNTSKTGVCLIISVSYMELVAICLKCFYY